MSNWTGFLATVLGISATVAAAFGIVALLDSYGYWAAVAAIAAFFIPWVRYVSETPWSFAFVVVGGGSVALALIMSHLYRGTIFG